MPLSRLVTFLSFLSLIFTKVSLAQEPVNYGKHIAQSITEIAAQDKLKAQVSNSFDNYLAARKALLLHACVHHLADYDSVELRPDFYTAENNAISHYKNAYSDFTRFTKIIATMTDSGEDEASEHTKKLLGSLETPEQLSYSTVTRGYCQVYGAGPEHAKMVSDTLEKYTVDIDIAKKREKLVGPAIYINKTNKIQNIIVSPLGQQTPTYLYIADQAFPIKCEYKDPRPYKENLARRNTPSKNTDLTYSATDYFYHHYSVQMNYVLSCQLDKPKFKDRVLTVADTYPWYQPKVIGADHRSAAGDAFLMAEGDKIAIVLGHESCVCNWSDQRTCSDINAGSRQYLADKQKLIDAMYKMKGKLYNEEDQNVIDPIKKIQQEIKNDFCFIDQNKIQQELDRLRAGIESIKPKQWWQFWK